MMRIADDGDVNAEVTALFSKRLISDNARPAILRFKELSECILPVLTD